jgi:hypothetical protein
LTPGRRRARGPPPRAGDARAKAAPRTPPTRAASRTAPHLPIVDDGEAGRGRVLLGEDAEAIARVALERRDQPVEPPLLRRRQPLFEVDDVEELARQQLRLVDALGAGERGGREGDGGEGRGAQSHHGAPVEPAERRRSAQRRYAGHGAGQQGGRQCAHDYAINSFQS